MFTSMSNILKIASDNNFGVVSFNCFNYASVACAIEAAELEGTPLIISEHPSIRKYLNYSAFAAMVKALAAEVKVPITCHLDHCSDIEEIRAALDGGFASVMYDGSRLPYEENLANTKKVVEMAKKYNADVEAELGIVGTAKNVGDFTDTDKYTRPEDAKDFAERSGCSSLAIAIGSAHGFYVETPKLDIGRLSEINAATPTPLVLHGGSGIPDAQILEAGHHGINKLNVATEFDRLFFDSMAASMKEREDRILWLTFEPTRELVMPYIRKKVHIAGA